MRLPHSVPCPNGTDRASRAKELRDLATEISRTRAHAATRANGEETDYSTARFPANFTKGLLHDQFGLVSDPQDYRAFVEAINTADNNLFDSGVLGAVDHPLAPGETMRYFCTIPGAPTKTRKPGQCEEVVKPAPKGGVKPAWRGWESPRAGHVYELEGPDADSVGMAPPPRVGSSELAAEMAEVYGLALLRDVRFTDICQGGGKKFCAAGGEAVLSSAEVVKLLNSMPYFSGKKPVSSTPLYVDSSGLNAFERARRFARTQDQANPYNAPLTTMTAFRGSTPGALRGPYLSQFMLVGSDSRAGAGNGASDYPGLNAKFDAEDGFIAYGAQIIDQRQLVHKSCLDHMTDWVSWRDVQNGADLRGQNLWEGQRRFITTPRDLATYVHFDALYQAYLNAVLLLDKIGVPTSRGFPEPSTTGRRTGFATFGGPHILSLVTEVATRCLKAVRRQKFNFHRRCRPEVIAGRLTLVDCKRGAELACAEQAFTATRDEIPKALREAIIKHNLGQNSAAMAAMRLVKCVDGKPFEGFDPQCNLLLPMAFPEGSPMHPSYGAGHATVAGGCVTMIKAFFEMFEDCDQGVERPLCIDGKPMRYVPTDDGAKLKEDDKFKGTLTIQGELDKLAANIAIGRNMAGVHFYADYYDSLRLGERVAVGILLEQAPTYGDPIESSFTSFDGDRITIAGQAGAAPMLTVIDRDGRPVAPRDWWVRHVPGEQSILDL